MSEENHSRREEEVTARAGDIDTRTGQPVEESEKNLSRHSNKNSNPAAGEQWRTTVEADDEESAGVGKSTGREQGGE